MSTIVVKLIDTENFRQSVVQTTGRLEDALQIAADVQDAQAAEKNANYLIEHVEVDGKDYWEAVQ